MKTLILILTLTFSLFAQHEWSEPVQLSEMGIPGSVSYSRPAIINDSNGVITVFWRKSVKHPTESLYCTQIEYRQSTDNGLTWSNTLYATPEYTEYSNDRIWGLRAVTDSENNIHLFYMKGFGFDNNKIKYKKYNGLAWTDSYVITQYSTSSLHTAIDKEDRIYVFWVHEGFHYYSYSDHQSERIWTLSDQIDNSGQGWGIKNNNFVFDEKNNLFATTGGYSITDGFSRPYLISYKKTEEKWSDFEEVGDFNTTSMGSALAMTKTGIFIANVSVGMLTNTDRNVVLSKQMEDSSWSEPIYLNMNTDAYTKKMFTDSVDNIHLIERYIIDSRSELIYSYTKGNTWYTETVQADENNTFDYFDATIEYATDRIFLVFIVFDGLNSNATCNYFQSKFIDTGIDGDTSSIPNKPILYKNYPNPFNSSTQIKFTLPKTSDVRLSVYNIKGEFIKDLINVRQNKGQHSVMFEANDLNSGIYYYRLVIDGIVEDSKKMLYLK